MNARLHTGQAARLHARPIRAIAHSYGILDHVRSPLETFAGLLDQSVREIAALAEDARTMDLSQISRLADIWDNNTFPLVSAACAPRQTRNVRARDGLLWMADLGASRRQLMTSLDPALDAELPAAFPMPIVHRDYRDEVRPGSFPMTAEVIAALDTDYDLSAARLRSLAVRPTLVGLCASLTLAAPRLFTPSSGCVTRDGSLGPWPPALLVFTLTDVRELAFDADDRTGAVITVTAAGITMAIGRTGHVRAASATVHPDDPRWHESAAGRKADAVTTRERKTWRERVPTSDLSEQEQAAAGALHDLMLRVRMTGYHPKLAGRIPLREICEAAEGAGTAILRAGELRGWARRRAFTGLQQQWRHLPRDAAPAPVPAAPAVLRYAHYSEPHDNYGHHRPGQATLVVATPGSGPATPWRVASEEIKQLKRFRLTAAAFDGVFDLHRDADRLTLGKYLMLQRE